MADVQYTCCADLFLGFLQYSEKNGSTRGTPTHRHIHTRLCVFLDVIIDFYRLCGVGVCVYVTRTTCAKRLENEFITNIIDAVEGL